MRKLSLSFIALALVLVGVNPVQAAVSVSTGPTSLVTVAQTLPASSSALPVFSFTLGQTASETLSSVAVTIHSTGTANLVSSDIASVAVYKDNGDASFNAGTDLLVGSQATPTIGSPVTITATANTSISNSLYFVVVATGSTFTNNALTKSFTVTLPVNAITASANSPTTSAVVTAGITSSTVSNTQGPVLQTAVAQNTASASGLQAGDSVVLTFATTTNQPVVTGANIASMFTLSSGHVFTDGAGNISSATWSNSGKTLTIVVSAGTNLPTVAVGDTVTMTNTTPITDISGNRATGSAVISGDFGGTVTPVNCNGLVNGKFYTMVGSKVVFQAVNCQLQKYTPEKKKKHEDHSFRRFIKNPKSKGHGGDRD